MKFQERQLWENIKSGEFLPVYLIRGDEAYLKQNYTKLLADHVVPAGLEAFNLHRFAGDTADLETIFTAVEALPAMCERTCVVVHDLDFAALNEADRDAMADFLKDLPDTCVLVFWQDTKPFPQKTKQQKELLKLIEAAGAVADLNGRSRGELIRFLSSESKKRGCSISSAAAGYMIDTVGEDMAGLISELDKLCCYAEGTITEQDVDAICVKSLESTAFKMVDALVAENFDAVFQSLAILFEQRTEPAMILGALTSTFVDMYRALVAKEAGKSSGVLKSLFPNAYRSDFKLNNAVKRARRYSPEALRRSLEILADADTRLKSSIEDNRVIFEKMLVELAEVRRAC